LSRIDVGCGVSVSRWKADTFSPYYKAVETFVFAR